MNTFLDSVKVIIGISVYLSDFLLRKEKVDIWLIGERKTEAKDNGYHLFKYIRTEHPAKKIFYIIDKNSDHKKRVAQYEQCIDHNSIRHYIYFFRANKLILPFETSTFPDSKLIWYIYRLKLLRKKVAFIQHGVTKEKQTHYSYNNRFKFDLFVCSAEAECEFVKKEMDYPEDIAKNLGLARYDNLNSNSSLKQIFFMPTWRAWMIDYTEQEFKDSDYYKNISLFLNNQMFQDCLVKHETTIILYLHDVFQKKFSHLFLSDSASIIIADAADYDVQTLLKQSKLLITDFSSIAFDFAYMGKPVLYFQFDALKYGSEHFVKGYFDYNDDGFGPVSQDVSSLVDNVLVTLASDYSLELKYFSRAQNFFGERDTENCLRNYRAIDEL